MASTTSARSRLSRAVPAERKPPRSESAPVTRRLEVVPAAEPEFVGRPEVPDSAPSRRLDLVAVGIFVGLTVWLTWPLVLHPLARVPENIADPLHLEWLISWQIHALGTDPLGMFDAPVFYPFEQSLALSEQLLVAAVMAAPTWIVSHNPNLVLNTVLFATFPIAAFGMYLLVRDVTGSRLAGVVAGIGFAFSAYRMARPTHIHVHLVMWIPYSLVALRRFIDVPRWRYAMALAGTLWLQLVSSGHGALIAAAVLPVAAVILLFGRWDRLRDRRMLSRGVVAAVVLAIAVVPFVAPYMRMYEQNPQFHRGPEEVALYSGGLEALFTAPSRNRLYGNRLDLIQGSYEFEQELFPGFFILILAGMGIGAGTLPSAGRRVRRWTFAFSAVALLGLLMSMGSDPGHGGVFGVVQQWVPGFENIRVPGRFSIATLIGLTGLAGIAVASARSLPRRWHAVAFSMAVSILLVAEGMPIAWAMVEVPPTPPGVIWLLTQPKDQPVLHLPTAEPFSPTEVYADTFQREGRYLSFQTQHWRPILNGYSSNLPPTYVEMAHAVQGFPDARSLEYLRGVGVRHVLVHRDLIPQTPWQDVGAAIPEDAVAFDDGTVFVVDVSVL